MSGLVDAHFHIWRRADLPWLQGPMQPRIFGPYEPLRRDYSIEEYRRDIAGTGVEAVVYVQANWAPARALEEVLWVEGEVRRAGLPVAIVAYADLLAEDAPRRLEELARHPAVRGVRQQLHWHEVAEYRFAPRPDLASDPRLIEGCRRLGELGLVFELQVFAGQVESALTLLRACPGTGFVLVHAGMLEDDSEAGFARWRAALSRLAAEPNLACKLSGLNTFVRRLDRALIARIGAAALELFGPRRCLFGSNFPIEKLWCGYRDLLDAYRAALAGLSEPDRRAVLSDNARRIYRLD
ncbi:MAG: amidohydrolase family protein [Geminicoccaceae bacterium]|nr:amidohydrolase family protein [Geminicoccaceae bacterium]MCX8101387.1 amidohydrolase family protein [Geminicoccaceae bacterium]MDW8371562.1 amidohydrolase family protein [Geminicoccaceae bacterium]